MVSGDHLRVVATMACVVIVSFPGACGLEEQFKKYAYNNNGLGTYSFEFETTDGTFRREDGGIVSETDGMVVRGEYGYIDPTSGHLYTVRYIADANGFQTQSSNEETRFNDRRIV